MNNEQTRQEINKLRARLFNQAEHILREIHRDDFDAIYKQLSSSNENLQAYLMHPRKEN
jgi:predicted translin family RNA/ssDNA-binding protein